MNADYLEKLPEYVDQLKEMRDTIIANIVLIGQIPAPTFKEKNRIQIFMERLANFHADECTTDGYRNPIGIIHGKSNSKPPIFVVAHLDTHFNQDIDHHYTVKENEIIGPGIIDNSVSVGVLASLPAIFKKLNLLFESNIVLAGAIQSIGKGNLRGIRHLLKTWPTPIRGAICLEGGELGRLNYYSDGMIRGEIECNISKDVSLEHKYKPNAILVLNEVINQILALKLPQRPRTKIVIGQISGGFSHGTVAYNAKLGFEIRSHSYKLVRSIYNDFKDIVDGISHEDKVYLKIKTISNLSAARLKYNHPLVKSTASVMRKLQVTPVSEPTETELSIFLSNNIPAVTLGITHGYNYYHENATIEIDPVFKGIAQLIGVIMAIDSGVCDEE